MNTYPTRNPQSAIRNRAAVMSEMVFVMPLLLVITSLVIWFGLLAVRVQHTQVMARYETWRTVAEAPGPTVDDPNGNPQLNSAFFASKAAELSHTIDDNLFPTDSYDQLVTDAGRLSNDAGNLAEALMYAPPDNAGIRMSHARREGFKVTYTTDIPLWRSFEGPIRRHTARIGTEWSYTNAWNAAGDLWASGGSHTSDHARALRDVFLKDFDDQLDAIDGDTNPEYPGDSTQVPSGQALAGFIRSLYLQEPAYRGPIVHDEKP
ncbi:MAG: hypothetical protein ACYC26_10230 [Phycisphaerales bacterium]